MGFLACRCAEIDLVADLRIAGVELTLVSVVSCVRLCTCARTIVMQAKQGLCRLFAVCLYKDPRNKDFAPSIALLCSVVEAVDCVNVPCILGVVSVACIRCLVVQLAVGCLFKIADFFFCYRNSFAGKIAFGLGFFFLLRAFVAVAIASKTRKPICVCPSVCNKYRNGCAITFSVNSYAAREAQVVITE